MDYIGSKEKLNEWIFSIILDGKSSNGLTFLDACAGSGSVSKYAANLDFSKIISNDIMEFPTHIVRGAVSLTQKHYDEANEYIKKLNEIDGVSGFFYQNYSKSAGRLFFTDDNAQKIDGMRQQLEKDISDPYIKSYILYCFLEAMSSVSNTTGVYAAFLKKFKQRAQNKIIIKSKSCLLKHGLVKTYNKNISSLLKSKSFRDGYQEDILYMDPPYNNRQYGPNYHLYETLVKYDNPKIFGKTGLRDWQSECKSDFCSKKTCLSFTKEIVDNTTAKNIFISYNSDGLMSIDEIKNVFNDKIVEVFSKDQKRYKSDNSEDRQYNTTELKEYLIKISK